MSIIPDEGRDQIEVKMEEGVTSSQKDSTGNGVAQTAQPVSGPASADPASDNANSGNRPHYIPQFSAATQMILQRINGKSGSLSSALSSASAVARTIEQSTYEDAKRRLVMNMNTSLTMPLPTPVKATSNPGASTGLPISDAFQLRTPPVAKPATSKGSAKIPVKRGRPPKGTKRKRSSGDQDDSSSLSDLPGSDGEGPSKEQAKRTMTKSGRHVQKPAQYNPISPAGTQKRKHYGKRTPDQALCKVCTRGLSPLKNQIVFCDGCNFCWHQLCHDPYIDDDFVSNETRSWFCSRCLAKREKHLAKKKSLDGFKGASWAAKSAEQKRTYLASVPHGQLVNILMYSLELHPDLPIFPTHEPSSGAKRGPQGPRAVSMSESLVLAVDANSNSPINYVRKISTPGVITMNSQQTSTKASSGSGRGATTENQNQAVRESSVDSIPPSWPKAGKGCLSGLEIREDDMQDKPDFEAFSVTTYDPKGKKVMENGMPVEANENTGT